MTSTTSLSAPESQTKQALVVKWDSWIKTQPLAGNAASRDALKFFLELQAMPSPMLMEFASDNADKWQVVHDWLRDEGRIAGRD